MGEPIATELVNEDTDAVLDDVPRANDEEKASFVSFLKLFWPFGFIGFGGPQAHVALMHSTFVDADTRDKNGNMKPHLAEETFLELHALTQSLPGPGSTQLATALGATFGGFLGGILTFLIFMLPGFVVMGTVGLLYHQNLNSKNALQTIHTVNEYLVGLIAAAFALVVVSSYKIITKCCKDDKTLYAICILTTAVSVNVSPKYASFVFVSLLIFGGSVSVAKKIILDFLQRSKNNSDDVEPKEMVSELTEIRTSLENWETSIPSWIGIVLLLVFLVGLVLSLAVSPEKSIHLRILDVFWTIGSVGFGGGTVVIPMLLNEIVDKGLLDESIFLAGFALIGIVPGPMSNLSAFLGGAIASWQGSILAWLGLFGPGVTIVLALLPFWVKLRKLAWVQQFVFGANAAASGLILTGVYMVLVRVIKGPASFSLAISAGVLMTAFSVSSPIAIIIHGFIGAFFKLLNIGGPFR